MISLLYKDLVIQKKTLFFATIYIIALMYLFQGLQTMMATGAIIAFTYLTVMGAFTYDDKNEADIMLNCLPLQRKKIVLAKYVSLYMFTILGSLLYLIFYQLGVTFDLPLEIYPLTLMGFASATLGIVFMNSISFPLLFKIGYAKARAINFVLFFGVFFGLPYLTRSFIGGTDLPFLRSVVEFFQGANQLTIASGLIGASILIAWLSYLLSCYFYQHREF